jgi:hypothetical protein
MVRSKLLAAALILTVCSFADAQQVAIETPFQNFSDSFYENIGINWNYRRSDRNGNGFFFNGPGATAPPFGMGDPGSDSRFGFSRRSGNSQFNLNFTAGQGSDRSNSVQSPRVMVPNGGTGFISDTSLRPFVTGIIPVVGNRGFRPPMRMTSPLEQAVNTIRQNPEILEQARREIAAEKEQAIQARRNNGSLSIRASSNNSTANRGDISVAAIKAQHAAGQRSQDKELAGIIEKGRGAEGQNNLVVAIIYYQQAARRADGELQYNLERKIQELKLARKR